MVRLAFSMTCRLSLCLSLLASFGCADPPPEVTNGVWKGTNISVTITCNSGYELEGPNTLICVKQNWEEVTQVCKKGIFSNHFNIFDML